MYPGRFNAYKKRLFFVYKKYVTTENGFLRIYIVLKLWTIL